MKAQSGKHAEKSQARVANLNSARSRNMQVKLTHGYAMQPNLMPEQASTFIVEGKNIKVCASLLASGLGLSRSW